jgi:hypothetical protein
VCWGIINLIVVAAPFKERRREETTFVENVKNV